METVDDRQTVKQLGRTVRGRSWLLVGAVVAALATGAASLAAPAAPPPATPRALGDFFLGARTARAEVVTVVGTAVKDVRIDLGRVATSTATSLVLLELDGTRQTIPIGPTTQIFGRGQLAPARAKVNAIAIREGEGPAQSVYLSVGAGRLMTPKILGQLFLGARMARAEVVMMVGGVLHDFRIDQGSLVSASPTALVVLERDNTEQTIPVSVATEVWLGNQLADVSALRPRMNVITVRDGDQPAQAVRAGVNRLQGRGQ
jgi:hypothetical protein